MTILRIILILTFAVSQNVAAEGFENLSEAKALSDQAMALFHAEQITEGYDVFKPYWPLAAVEIDAMASQTNMQWPVVRQRFGESLGIEFIGEYSAGESLAKFVYLHKFERHAIRWNIVLYKPGDIWVINGIFFDDNVYSLLCAQSC